MEQGWLPGEWLPAWGGCLGSGCLGNGGLRGDCLGSGCLRGVAARGVLSGCGCPGWLARELLPGCLWSGCLAWGRRPSTVGSISGSMTQARPQKKPSEFMRNLRAEASRVVKLVVPNECLLWLHERERSRQLSFASLNRFWAGTRFCNAHARAVN